MSRLLCQTELLRQARCHRACLAYNLRRRAAHRDLAAFPLAVPLAATATLRTACTSVPVPVPAVNASSTAGVRTGSASWSSRVPSSQTVTTQPRVALESTATATVCGPPRAADSPRATCAGASAPPLAPVASAMKSDLGQPATAWSVANITLTPASPPAPSSGPFPPTELAVTEAGLSSESVIPSPPLPPDNWSVKLTRRPAAASGTGVSTVSLPEAAALPLNDQPPPGPGTGLPPVVITADRTWCRSVLVPVAPVKASLTTGGSLSHFDRYRVPSTQTASFPPAAVTVTRWVPVRSGGTLVEVAANTSWPPLTPVAIPTKFADG